MRLLVVLPVLATLALIGCGDDSDSGSDVPDLAGTAWELTSLGGEPVATAGASWIAFGEDGNAMGVGGCNGFTGGYAQDGASLSIGPLAATQMLCPDEELDVQEQGFFAALGATTGVELDGGTLTLSDDDGELAVLAESDKPTGIVGAWTAVAYNNGNEAVVSVIDGSELTAEFADDGTVSGSAGCNSFTGGYTVDGDTVSIGPLASTRMACAEPDGIMDQEAQYVAALESAATFSVRGGVLELRTADDAIAVTLTPG